MGSLKNERLLIGSGGYFTEYRKPLFSNISTTETVRRQIEIIKWYSQHGLDLYVLQDQLISKKDAKQFRDVNAVQENSQLFQKMGDTLRRYDLDCWVHTSRFVNPSTPKRSVKEMTIAELSRFHEIIKITDKAVRCVTTHLGGRYKGKISYKEAMENAISMFKRLGLGKLLCLENEYNKGKLGSCEEILRACEETNARPLFDITHFRIRENDDWFEMFRRFASFWDKNDRVIVHYGSHDRKNTYSSIDWKDFENFCRKLLDTQYNVSIDLETPQDTRLKNSIIAKKIANRLMDE